MKKLVGVLLVLLLVGGLGLVGAVALGEVEDSTNVSGIIHFDTRWTRAGSPYVLTGLVGVASGVTLTIEPGVMVNLGEYTLQVGGTLYARGGSGANNITFLSKSAEYGNIAFTNGSVGWNSQTGSGSIIENAILSSTSISINNASPKINNNTITGSLNVDYEASPLISNNLIAGDIGVHSSSPKIDHNSIIGGINIGGNAPVISNNIIEGGGVSGIGIRFDGPYSVNISHNVVYGCSTGVSGYSMATLDGNLIIDNDDGIKMSSSQILIQNNTVARNSVGIRLLGLYNAITITNDNIQDNIQNSIYLENCRADVDAVRNWWGTIDSQVINLTIHDRKNEPKLGIVSFAPTISTPVPEAPTTDYTPISGELPPSQEPATTTPEQPATQFFSQAGILEIAVAVIILSVVINISLVVVVARLLKKKQ